MQTARRRRGGGGGVGLKKKRSNTTGGTRRQTGDVRRAGGRPTAGKRGSAPTAGPRGAATRHHQDEHLARASSGVQGNPARGTPPRRRAPSNNGRRGRRRGGRRTLDGARRGAQRDTARTPGRRVAKARGGGRSKESARATCGLVGWRGGGGGGGTGGGGEVRTGGHRLPSAQTIQYIQAGGGALDSWTNQIVTGRQIARRELPDRRSVPARPMDSEAVRVQFCSSEVTGWGGGGHPQLTNVRLVV